MISTRTSNRRRLTASRSLIRRNGRTLTQQVSMAMFNVIVGSLIHLYAQWFFCIPDGGFIYIQNAQPNGPSVWIFLEATDRLLRHTADDWEWMISLGLSKKCNFMDQEMLNEVLGSVVAGRVIWKDTLAKCAVDKTNVALKRKHEAVKAFVRWNDRRQVGESLQVPDLL